MVSKECDLGSNLEVPDDSIFILNEEGLVVGIKTTDASFDYSEGYRKFLEPNNKKDPVK